MAVRVDDVLKATAGVSSLTNMFLRNGWVFLDRGGLIDLLLGAARRRLYKLAEELSNIDSESLDELALQVKISVDEIGLDEIGFIEEALPECTKRLIDKAMGGERLSEEELYVLVTFLANINAPTTLLASVLDSSRLAPRNIARMMAEVLMREAKSFKPYNCRQLTARGICERCPKEGLLEEYKVKVKRMALEKGLSLRRTGGT